jgi:hypothetical protein
MIASAQVNATVRPPMVFFLLERKLANVLFLKKWPRCFR